MRETHRSPFSLFQSSFTEYSFPERYLQSPSSVVDPDSHLDDSDDSVCRQPSLVTPSCLKRIARTITDTAPGVRSVTLSRNPTGQLEGGSSLRRDPLVTPVFSFLPSSSTTESTMVELVRQKLSGWVGFPPQGLSSRQRHRFSVGRACPTARLRAF